MTKRLKTDNRLLTLGDNLLLYHVFQFLTSKDAAKLAETNRHLRSLVRRVVKFRLHWIDYSHPSEIGDFSSLHWCFDERFEHGYDTLINYGYLGEGRCRTYDYKRHRFVLFNDFYMYSYSDSVWFELVKKLEQDTEFDFQWKFIHFPTLPSNDRYQILGNCTIHRGDCLWISWKA